MANLTTISNETLKEISNLLWDIKHGSPSNEFSTSRVYQSAIPKHAVDTLTAKIKNLMANVETDTEKGK